MSTVDRLLTAAKDVWDGYHTHPFVEGLKYGNLDTEKFRFYMIQDFWYLMEYTKVLQSALPRAKALRP